MASESTINRKGTPSQETGGTPQQHLPGDKTKGHYSPLIIYFNKFLYMDENQLLLNQFDATMAKFSGRVGDLEEQVRKGIAAQGKLGGGGQFSNSFEAELAKKLLESAPLLQNLKHNKTAFSFEMETKVVGDTTFGNFVGAYPSAQMLPGYTPKLYESLHVRQFFPGGFTSANVVRHPVDKGGEGVPTTVLEAGLKPQIDRDIEIKDAPVRKIAAYFRISEEALEDNDYMRSLLTQMGTEELLAVEDFQLLYGDGVAPNLAGLDTVGTAFAAGSSIVVSPNNYDVISAAKKQLRNNKMPGTVYALVHPDDYFVMKAGKDDAKNYTFQAPSLSPLNGSITADGVAIIESTAVTPGDFFVFSPRAAQVIDRLTTSVRFLQGTDEAIHNMYLVILEKRLAFPIFYPGGIIKGDFASAITDLTA